MGATEQKTAETDAERARINAEALAKLPPIFARCVDAYQKRYAFDRPFVQDGYLYATTGAILVRIPTPADWPFPNAEGRLPEVAPSLVGKFERTPVELPTVKLDPCESCGGSLKVECRECPDCNGDGEDENEALLCDCPHCAGHHDCETCEGTGNLPAGQCPDCARTGFGDGCQSVEVGPVNLDRRIVAMLKGFGASVFLPKSGNADKVRFLVGDVEGFLMGMRS